VVVAALTLAKALAQSIVAVHGLALPLVVAGPAVVHHDFVAANCKAVRLSAFMINLRVLNNSVVVSDRARILIVLFNPCEFTYLGVISRQ
jgi:hypothetical protein